MHRALLFPGQGAQFVGMGKKLLAAGHPSTTQLFDRASELLGYDLLHACTDGPAELLNSTRVSQPAILVTSLAAATHTCSQMPPEERPVRSVIVALVEH